MFARFCSPVSLLLAVMVSLSPVLSCVEVADLSEAKRHYPVIKEGEVVAEATEGVIRATG